MGAAAVPIFLATSILGTAVQAYGAMQQSQAQADQQEYQAAVARNNALIAQQNAQEARDRGTREENRQRLRTLQATSSSRASAAARGLDVNTGTPLDIADTIAGVGEIDALTIRSNTDKEVRNYMIQKQGFTNESSLRSANADNISDAGFISTAGTLLSGASSVAGKWYQLNKK